MKSAEVRIRDSGNKAAGTVSVTDQAVRAALAQYDLQYPDNDYPRTDRRPDIKTWFQNDTYKYAVHYEGSCYPAKEIARLAIGPGPQEGYRLAGGSQRGSVVWMLEELGCEVISKQECQDVT